MRLPRMERLTQWSLSKPTPKLQLQEQELLQRFRRLESVRLVVFLTRRERNHVTFAFLLSTQHCEAIARCRATSAAATAAHTSVILTVRTCHFLLPQRGLAHFCFNSRLGPARKSKMQMLDMEEEGKLIDASRKRRRSKCAHQRCQLSGVTVDSVATTGAAILDARPKKRTKSMYLMLWRYASDLIVPIVRHTRCVSSLQCWMPARFR